MNIVLWITVSLCVAALIYGIAVVADALWDLVADFVRSLLAEPDEDEEEEEM